MTDAPRAAAPALPAIVLAAGTASRIGVAKFALAAGPGETLLTRVVGVALDAIDGPIHVITGRDADLARAEVARWCAERPSAAARVAFVHNPDFERGLSTSLRAGVIAVAASAADGVLVLLADQPGLDVDLVRGLAATFAARAPATVAVAAAWDGEQRTPVVLDRALFAEVAQLAGDQGARRLLRARPDAVVLVDWGQGPWTVDVDTWGDYRALAARLGWSVDAR